MKKSNNGNFQLSMMAEALTDSVNLKQYIKRMCSRDESLSLNQGTLLYLGSNESIGC